MIVSRWRKYTRFQRILGLLVDASSIQPTCHTGKRTLVFTPTANAAKRLSMQFLQRLIISALLLVSPPKLGAAQGICCGKHDAKHGCPDCTSYQCDVCSPTVFEDCTLLTFLADSFRCGTLQSYVGSHIRAAPLKRHRWLTCFTIL